VLMLQSQGSQAGTYGSADGSNASNALSTTPPPSLMRPANAGTPHEAPANPSHWPTSTRRAGGRVVLERVTEPASPGGPSLTGRLRGPPPPHFGASRSTTSPSSSPTSCRTSTGQRLPHPQGRGPEPPAGGRAPSGRRPSSGSTSSASCTWT
jgi:hypothetical protein